MKKITKSLEMNLVSAGRKGVTNKQMLDVFKSEVSNEVLIQLLNDYPEVFMSSIKYTPDATKLALEKLVKENGYPEFEVKTGKKIRTVEAAAVVEEKIIVLDTYKNKNNEKMAVLIDTPWKNTLTDVEKEMFKKMVQEDIGISKLAEEFGLTKDQAYNKVFRSKSSIYNKLTAAN